MDEPGSMKHYVKWPDATHAQIGNFKYDVGAICDHFKLDSTDFCVSNLSIKLGKSKFALCPCWGEKGHEDAKSSAHTVPKNFNMKFINSVQGWSLGN